jgi:hypothetical protein
MEAPSGHFDICAVCFWEDDNIQLGDPTYAPGANKFSLEQSRRNFQAFGAVEERLKRYVRQPRPDELPSPPGEWADACALNSSSLRESTQTTG